MSWTIEEHENVAVFHMNSNKVNAMNQAFFDDWNEAMDIIRDAYPDSPVVFFSDADVFSVGLDFYEVFRLFSTASIKDVEAWAHNFTGNMLRLYNMENPL